MWKEKEKPSAKKLYSFHKQKLIWNSFFDLDFSAFVCQDKEVNS